MFNVQITWNKVYAIIGDPGTDSWVRRKSKQVSLQE